MQWLIQWLIALFCSSSCLLFGYVAVTENDPSALVEGIVNAITGDVYALEDDILIQGTEPLRLRRSYISAKGAGNWHFFETLIAVLYPPLRMLSINEPNGTTLIYRYQEQSAESHKKKHKEKIFLPLNVHQDAQGLTNTARGKISAHTNLKNQYVHMDKHEEVLTVVSPNGAKRTYKAIDHQKASKLKGSLGLSMSIYYAYYYRLESEELPNGNKILYRWHPDYGALQSIRTTDPNGQKIYAEATFSPHGKFHEKKDRVYRSTANFDIRTTDGRLLEYRYFCEGDHHEDGIWYLCAINSSDTPLEELRYHPKDKHRNPILSTVSLPHKRDLKINYYDQPGDPCYGRVHEILAPVSTDGIPIVTHTFHYDLQKRCTSVIDSQSIPTHYYWDEQSRLTRIDRFATPTTLYNSTLLIWGESHGPDATNLICKVLLDEQRTPMHATTRIYDTCGNVLSEKFYGNLTGTGTPLALNPQNLPVENGVECYTKRFTYDGRNLLIRKEEDNGSATTYEYLPGTDLPTAELSFAHGQIQRRTFYTYNPDRILIKEITDDGTTADPLNVSGVKSRLIRSIQLKSDAPYFGMPHKIEEKYGDGCTEQLLKKTVYAYTTGGRVASKEIYDANSRFSYRLTYNYDEKGNLSQETNALGQTAVSQYDSLGNKTSFSDFGSRTHTEMHYDCSNRLVASNERGDDGTFRSTRHAYNTKHEKMLTVDPHGYETRYVYDAAGQLIQTHLPSVQDMHPVHYFTYNAAGCETARTDAEGYTTHTTYNAYGKPLTIIHPDETRESFTYNLDGTLHTACDQNGVMTSYTYDVFARITSITKSLAGDTLSHERFDYDSYHLIAKTDAENHTTFYTYDSAGRKIAEELNEERIEYSYDPLGRLYAIQQGELITITQHDLLDRIVEERKEDLTGVLLSKVAYTYDSAGNKQTITRWIDGAEATEHFTYDAFNRLIQKQDPLGNTTTLLYDDTHHTQTHIDPLGLHTIEQFNAHYLLASKEKRSSELLLREDNRYDANTHLIAKTSQIHEHTLQERTITTLWAYDPLGRLSTLTEAADTPEEKVTHYSYTPNGKLYQTIKPSGTILIRTYDALNNLTSLTSSDGTIHYTYLHNRLGHLLQSHDALTHTTLYRTYDPKGCLLTDTLPTNLPFRHTYDPQGRRIRLDLPDSSSITYTYDALHMKSVTRHAPSHTYTHTYASYDLNGNPLTEICIAHFGRLTRHFDTAGRVLSLTAPHFSQDLQYDPIGNILYSRLHNDTLTYTYDPLYQLTSEKGHTFHHTYAHDAYFNRLQKDTHTYTVNALNQIPSEYTYTPDGNPSRHADVHYTYDALDRLTCVETPTQKVQYTYDSLHRRLTKTLNQQTIYFLYDGQNEIGAVDTTGHTIELRILGRTPQAEIGSAIALELHDKIYIPIHDLHGNLATLYSLSDHTTETYRYTAFGEEIDPQPTLNPWRFSSKRIDEETHLVYFGRRYYNPHLGRWLTPDPLGLDAGPNLYAFVSNAPLTHVDLYGLLLTVNDMKQIGIGALHGIGDFGLGVGSFLGTVGWGLTTPLRAMDWMTGRSSFSQDWRAWRQSQADMHAMGNRWMQRLLPGDTNHSLYRSFRHGVADGLELGSTLGGVAAARGAYSLVTKGTPVVAKGINGLQKIARPTIRIGETAAKSIQLKNLQWKLSGSPIVKVERLSGSNGFLGHRGFELQNVFYQPLRNKPISIQGRSYSSHALDQMQNRGLMPSVIEETIQSGSASIGKKPGTMAYYDSINNATVILNKDGTVITCSYGRINQ